jgi:hypothetical protein
VVAAGYETNRYAATAIVERTEVLKTIQWNQKDHHHHHKVNIRDSIIRASPLAPSSAAAAEGNHSK